MVATFPGAGSPPALWDPSGGGRNGSIFTTFRWYDATRHRRPRRRIRRRLWTRPCGKVAVRQGVPHHIDGDQDHKISWPQPLEHPHRVLFLTRSPPAQAPLSTSAAPPIHARPAQDAHLPARPARGQSPTPLPHRMRTIRRTTSLGSPAQHQNKTESWPHLPGEDQTSGEAPPRMTRRRPPRYWPVLALSPVPTNKIIARDSHPHQHGTPRPPQ